jgi:hypothetical protein
LIKITREQKIGARVALVVFLLGALGIVITLTIISGSFLVLIFFPTDYSLVVLLLSILFWGSRAGVQIIRDRKDEDWIGVKTSALILFSFMLSRIPLEFDLNKALSSWWSFKNWAGAVFTIVAVLLLPTVAYGMILGRRIKKYI